MKGSSIGKLILILPIAAVAFCLGIRYERRKSDPGTHSVIQTDTTSVIGRLEVAPKPKDSTVIHHVWVKLPIPIESTSDSTEAHDGSAFQDSAVVNIPIERKVYAEDSLYRAVVSGFRPSLDSLVIYPRTTTITITKTNYAHPPKWSLGITAGPSVLSTPSGKVHAGLGITCGLSYHF
ncbi:MAG: hypothetical protein J5886_06485 [Bacteroidales bacterium]|nr:hypothetical protein [Bacteroidales bacterium]